ncbi:hypothetical protein Tco_0875606 [Tanacetum coccineum]|uniref:Uncharacterized protein n=1 Tax=Tanacetum coccineum TaxID=301880 RepID=A0ABQ5BPX6_9ASTR
MDKVQKPSLESTAQVPPPEEEESIFIEILKPKAKKTVNIEIQEPNSPKPTSFQLKTSIFPERMEKDDIDEIDAFLAMEVSSNFEEGYFDSEGDVIFLENLLSDDTTHNLAPEVISDHEPNESIHNTSITFSPRSDLLHQVFASETLLHFPSGCSVNMWIT